MATGWRPQLDVESDVGRTKDIFPLSEIMYEIRTRQSLADAEEEKEKLARRKKKMKMKMKKKKKKKKGKARKGKKSEAQTNSVDGIGVGDRTTDSTQGKQGNSNDDSKVKNENKIQDEKGQTEAERGSKTITPSTKNVTSPHDKSGKKIWMAALQRADFRFDALNHNDHHYNNDYKQHTQHSHTQKVKHKHKHHHDMRCARHRRPPKSARVQELLARSQSVLRADRIRASSISPSTSSPAAAVAAVEAAKSKAAPVLHGPSVSSVMARLNSATASSLSPLVSVPLSSASSPTVVSETLLSSFFPSSGASIPSCSSPRSLVSSPPTPAAAAAPPPPPLASACALPSDAVVSPLSPTSPRSCSSASSSTTSSITVRSARGERDLQCYQHPQDQFLQHQHQYQRGSRGCDYKQKQRQQGHRPSPPANHRHNHQHYLAKYQTRQRRKQIEKEREGGKERGAGLHGAREGWHASARQSMGNSTFTPNKNSGHVNEVSRSSNNTTQNNVFTDRNSGLRFDSSPDAYMKSRHIGQHKSGERAQIGIPAVCNLRPKERSKEREEVRKRALCIQSRLGSDFKRTSTFQWPGLDMERNLNYKDADSNDDDEKNEENEKDEENGKVTDGNDGGDVGDSGDNDDGDGPASNDGSIDCGGSGGSDGSSDSRSRDGIAQNPSAGSAAAALKNKNKSSNVAYRKEIASGDGGGKWLRSVSHNEGSHSPRGVNRGRNKHTCGPEDKDQLDKTPTSSRAPASASASAPAPAPASASASASAPAPAPASTSTSTSTTSKTRAKSFHRRHHHHLRKHFNIQYAQQYAHHLRHYDHHRHEEQNQFYQQQLDFRHEQLLHQHQLKHRGHHAQLSAISLASSSFSSLPCKGRMGDGNKGKEKEGTNGGATALSRHDMYTPRQEDMQPFDISTLLADRAYAVDTPFLPQRGPVKHRTDEQKDHRNDDQPPDNSVQYNRKEKRSHGRASVSQKGTEEVPGKIKKSSDEEKAQMIPSHHHTCTSDSYLRQNKLPLLWREMNRYRAEIKTSPHKALFIASIKHSQQQPHTHVTSTSPPSKAPQTSLQASQSPVHTNTQSIGVWTPRQR